jgi:general nucleoside transport system ATP-binding protein
MRAMAGIGMVYQHFTLVPCLTAAENLVISRADAPAVIDWKGEARARRLHGADAVPVPLDVPVSSLSAGEKQKLEILKQLYLDQRFLILDEPTSVLTPGEADEVLGLLGDMARSGRDHGLMISHKFREVRPSADDVTVLRRGKLAGGGARRTFRRRDEPMMIGDTRSASARRARRHNAAKDRAGARRPLRRRMPRGCRRSRRST